MISASVSVDPVYRSSQLCVSMLHNKRALTMINNYIKRYKVKREKEERKEQGELKIQLDQRLLKKKKGYFIDLRHTHTHHYIIQTKILWEIFSITLFIYFFPIVYPFLKIMLLIFKKKKNSTVCATSLQTNKFV